MDSSAGQLNSNVHLNAGTAYAHTYDDFRQASRASKATPDTSAVTNDEAQSKRAREEEDELLNKLNPGADDAMEADPEPVADPVSGSKGASDQTITYEAHAVYTNPIATVLELLKLALRIPDTDKRFDELIPKDAKWCMENYDRSKVLASFLHGGLLAMKENPYEVGPPTARVRNLVLPTAADGAVDPVKVFTTAFRFGQTLTSSAFNEITITKQLPQGQVVAKTISLRGDYPLAPPVPLPMEPNLKKLVPKLPPLQNQRLMESLTTYYEARSDTKHADLAGKFGQLCAELKASVNSFFITYPALSAFMKFYKTLFPHQTTAFGGIHPAFLSTFSSVVLLREALRSDDTTSRIPPILLSPSTFKELRAKLTTFNATLTTPYELFPLLDSDVTLSDKFKKKLDLILQADSGPQADSTYERLVRCVLISLLYDGICFTVDSFPSYAHLETLHRTVKGLVYFHVAAPEPRILMSVTVAKVPLIPEALTAHYNAQTTTLVKTLFSLLYAHKPVSFTCGKERKADHKSVNITDLWNKPPTVVAVTNNDVFDLRELMEDAVAK